MSLMFPLPSPFPVNTIGHLVVSLTIGTCSPGSSSPDTGFASIAHLNNLRHAVNGLLGLDDV
jgi:hypothetical protein